MKTVQKTEIHFIGGPRDGSKALIPVSKYLKIIKFAIQDPITYEEVHEYNTPKVHHVHVYRIEHVAYHAPSYEVKSFARYEGVQKH